MAAVTLSSSSSVPLVLGHVAEEEGIDDDLPPTINHARE
jgi:hypothetical protein